MSVNLRGGKTVLVVDDANDVRTMVAAGLGMVGYKVVTVEGCAAALAELGHHKIDAILTDYWMPRMTGTTLAWAIRTDARHQHIPMSLFSAAPPENIDRTLFSHFLLKPCSLNEIVDTIDQMCFSSDRTSF